MVLIGKQPAFALTGAGSAGGLVYVLTPVVAAVGALIGVRCFQKGTLALRASDDKHTSRYAPAWVRPSHKRVVTWALGASVFVATGRLGVFGLGYSDLSAGLNHELTWKIAGLLLAAKLVATVAC